MSLLTGPLKYILPHAYGKVFLNSWARHCI
uniref:Uncharacterized protein n=1 Tax=Anguilla anguilla TaxID=7936 RepID=A0A0E9VJL1_ANGAN